MCGIHGFIDAKLPPDNGNKIIRKMVLASNHRGPDFSDVIQRKKTFLGHNRLSILDLSSNGNQPMHLNELSIVFNGEIYNYKEIRADLINDGIKFNTETDTEVILQSYIKWGESCVNKFSGMWSFAIWNNIKDELFCSRDRFGIKPFYYIKANDIFYFSSEIKSLRVTPHFSSELNINQCSRALQMGWMSFKDQTFLNEVTILEPGNNLTFKNGKIRISKYWKIEKTDKVEDTTDNLVEKFKDLFNDSLKLHLRSDVPVGATLSGGIDSSAIVCSLLSNHSIKDLQTFSIYYEGSDAVDERPFINKIVEQYPSQFKANFYSPSGEIATESYHDIMHHCDFPLLGSSPISQFFVMQEIKKAGIKVILSGQGADDYLGGYMHSFYRYFGDQFRNFQFSQFFSEFGKHKRNQAMDFKQSTSVFGKSFLSSILNEQQLYNLEFKRYYPFLTNSKTKNKLQFEKTSFNKFDDFHSSLMNYSSLPTLLHYEDRNSMAASIESRVPFLDHKLVEFGFAVKNDLKIRNGLSKWILRESMKNVMPREIVGRKDKKGFVTPGEVRWLRGDLKHLLEIDYTNLPFIDKSLTNKVISQFKKGDNSKASLVWRIASLNYWVKNFN